MIKVQKAEKKETTLETQYATEALLLLKVICCVHSRTGATEGYGNNSPPIPEKELTLRSKQSKKTMHYSSVVT